MRRAAAIKRARESEVVQPEVCALVYAATDTGHHALEAIDASAPGSPMVGRLLR
jgi:hypothetical protein